MNVALKPLATQNNLKNNMLISVFGDLFEVKFRSFFGFFLLFLNSLHFSAFFLSVASSTGHRGKLGFRDDAIALLFIVNYHKFFFRYKLS
jgi:hypothetical protein